MAITIFPASSGDEASAKMTARTGYPAPEGPVRECGFFHPCEARYEMRPDRFRITSRSERLIKGKSAVNIPAISPAAFPVCV